LLDVAASALLGEFPGNVENKVKMLNWSNKNSEVTIYETFKIQLRLDRENSQKAVKEVLCIQNY